MKSNPVAVVRSAMDPNELLCQLASDANKLGYTALQLRQINLGIDPAPTNPEECKETLLEKLADMSNCLIALGYDSTNHSHTLSRAKEQMERWADRLMEQRCKPKDGILLNTSRAARMCPVCGSDSAVYDSREQEDGIILRRRKCLQCDLRFATAEVLNNIIK